ncbi:MAG TPA: TIGR04222 domain-containing membrane protein, partial [Kofleriaceae bacterium]|nr:TIGR04222 domain-containing membrane protein [Kofleriaceae bacterium]
MNPFDLAGPEFLAFWIAGCVATTVVVLLVRVHVARDRTRDPHDVVLGTLHPTEAAYLVGGITRAIEAAVAGLHHEGRVAIDDAGLVTRTGKAGPLTIAPDGVFRGVVVDGELPRVESYVMQHLPASVRELVAGAEHVDFVLRQKLQEKGLLVAHETASHWMRAPAIAWLVVGVAKI